MDMNSKWMNKTFLALSIQMVMGVAFAAEEPALGEYETVDEEVVVETAAAVQPQTEQAETQVAEDVELGGYEVVEDTTVKTTVPVEAQPKQVTDASQALQQQEGDATQAANLEEVFTSNERQYSLIKKGDISSYYDIDYTYYRDTQLDLEMAQGQLYQLRVQENATHTLTNTFTFQYGVKDNLTLTASLPLVAKTDLLKDTSTAGLGDISMGARWEPFPLKAGRLPLILFANLSTKTGESPYEINAATDLGIGKGYYSAGLGASTRKYIDPVVLFASISANYGFKESGLNQRRGYRIIEEFDPGISGGFAVYRIRFVCVRW